METPRKVKVEFEAILVKTGIYHSTVQVLTHEGIVETYFVPKESIHELQESRVQ